MKIAFCTCVQLGFSCIEKIHELGVELDLLITLKDSKARAKSGRIYLDDFAKKNNVDLLKIDHINDQEVVDVLVARQIDWLFIIGWSQIANDEVLNSVKMGVLGAHPTLLPQGRGRASIPWAIIKDLDKTGVTLFKLDAGVDTGPICAQVEIPLESRETATSLYRKVNEAHIALIELAMHRLTNDALTPVFQDEGRATTWEGRTPADGVLSEDMRVEQVDRLVRATTSPYPGAFIDQGDSKVVIWEGRPAAMGKASDPDSFEIEFSDGKYVATRWERFEY